MELNQETRFAGRFKVIGCLGTGHNGPVFLARDTKHDNAVIALKVFHEWALGSKKERAQLRMDLKALDTLDCAGVSKPLEYLEDKGVKALCLQYVEGQGLATFVEEKPLSIDQIISLLEKLAYRLHDLHLKGYVHNDIKPAHILINPDGEITLCGCPKPIGAQTETGVNSRMYLGAAHYIAPEFLRSGIAQPFNDIYSLGMLGSELLEKLMISQTNKAKSVQHAWVKAFIRLEKIFKKALQSEPTYRHQDCLEFIEELQDFSRLIPRSSYGTLFVCFFAIFNVLALTGLFFLSRSVAFKSWFEVNFPNPF